MTNVTPIFAPAAVSPVQYALEYVTQRGLKPEILELAAWKLVNIDDLFPILNHNRAVWAAKKSGFTCGFYFPANGDPTSQIYRTRLLGSGPELATPPSSAKDFKAFKGKYLGMTKELNSLYQPPLPINPDSHDLWIVEGAGNALRLAQDGLDAVGIPGVDNWRIKDKASPVIPELLTRVGSANVKRVILGFDSDAQFNQKMQVSLNGLANALLKSFPKTNVCFAYPPNCDDGSKWGWDDFLQAKGRAAFDAHLGTTIKRWDDNAFIRKCLEWQRYILIEAEGQFFDTHPAIFSGASKGTADLAMANDSVMLNPMAHRVEMIKFRHDHYLNSPYALRAKYVEMRPDVDKVHFKDHERNIWVLNNYRFDLIPDPVKGDVSWWYAILDNITKDSPSAKDKLLKLVARKIQNPTEHFPLSIGIIGDQGAGKSLFAHSIGVCVNSFSGGRVNMNDTDNTSWAGHLVREWSEMPKDFDAEVWKQLIRDEYQEVRKLYASPRKIRAQTLHIATNNKAKQLVEKGDRVMIFAGYGKKLSAEVGLAAFKMIGSVNEPGPGIAALRYHLLYEVNTDDLSLMDSTTEIRGEIITASQTSQEFLYDELLLCIEDIPGLEILPASLLATLSEQLGFKGSFMSFRKGSRDIGTVGSSGVKIDGIKVRFCALKNQEKWKTEVDPEEYKKQYKMAYPLLNSRGKY